MNKINLLVLTGFLIISFSSCVVLSPKKYNALLAQKDSLSLGWESSRVRVESLEEEMARLRTDTSRLSSRLTELEGRLQGLDANYASLRSNSSTEINKLSEDLKKREARLMEVEEILRKRDEAANALKNKLQKALLGFQQSGLTVDIRDGKVYVSLTDKPLFASCLMAVIIIMKTLKRFLIVLFLFSALLSSTGPVAEAQCSMCTLSAENSVQNGNTQGKGLNKGILLLLAAPYVAIAGVGYIWYTRYRKKNVAIDIKDEKINLN